MLGFLQNIGHIFYRIWFYVLVALPIFLFSPFLLLTVFSEKTYPQFFWLARNLWAKPIFIWNGMFPKN